MIEATENVIQLLEVLGITCRMPALLEAAKHQLSTEDANESRLVTTTRWLVEARNGHIKSIFKFFGQLIPTDYLPNLGDFYRIAGAFMNKYHQSIFMEKANAELAQRLLEKAKEPNIIQALVKVENLAARNAQRWVRLDAEHLNNFSVLTFDYLKNLTIGIYQIKLAPPYVQNKLQRNGEEVFQVELLRDGNRSPQAGLLRVRIFSRFRIATCQLWIA